MNNPNRISVSVRSDSVSGGAYVNFNEGRFTVATWCHDVEVNVVISHEQASFIAERLLDQQHDGAVHAFTSDAIIFNASSGEQL